MAKRPPISRQRVEKMRDRERNVGLEHDDAARWLDENAPREEPAVPKSAGKSKLLHRWRQRQPPKHD